MNKIQRLKRAVRVFGRDVPTLSALDPRLRKIIPPQIERIGLLKVYSIAVNSGASLALQTLSGPGPAGAAQ
jgi:hypothetical protein